MALVERHDAGEYACPKASPPENPFGNSQTPHSRGLRQPAICYEAYFRSSNSPIFPAAVGRICGTMSSAVKGWPSFPTPRR